MKKKLLLLFTAGVLATLTACGSSDAATATDSTVESADTEAEDSTATDRRRLQMQQTVKCVQSVW